MAKEHDETVLEDDEEIEETLDDLDEQEEEEDEDDADADKPITLTKKALDQAIEKGAKKLLDKQNAARRRNNQSQNRTITKKPTQTRVDGDAPLAERLDRFEETQFRRDFAEEHGLNRKEAALVFRFNPKPTAKTLQDPFIQGGLARLREQSELGDNTPSGASAKTFVVDGKKWEDMDAKEKQKNFGAHQAAILKGQK